MADTPIEYFGSKDFQDIKELNAECFALEQKAKVREMEMFLAALLHARFQLGLEEVRIRGEYRRAAEQRESQND